MGAALASGRFGQHTVRMLTLLTVAASEVDPDREATLQGLLQVVGLVVGLVLLWAAIKASFKKK
jgi:sulfite exporter TauE/SafE